MVTGWCLLHTYDFLFFAAAAAAADRLALDDDGTVGGLCMPRHGGQTDPGPIRSTGVMDGNIMPSPTMGCRSREDPRGVGGGGRDSVGETSGPPTMPMASCGD